MDPLTTILIAVGLAMDAFAVSIARGIVTKRQRQRSAVILASSFGGFQMLMPAVGWLVGLSFEAIIMGFDHWVAFGLLTFIGLRMIYDSTRKEKEQDAENLKLHSVLALAVATSIDALMVGLSFAFIQTTVLEPILVIGLVTFLLSIVGFFFGCGLGRIFGRKVKIVGGLILIAIGFRILSEHLL